MTTSDDTLLRLVQNTSEKPVLTPRVLALDDWAWAKGTRCGAILVDLEKHCPVDLLPDPSAEMLATRLKEHLGVELISRDRAPSYIDGATQRASVALQVADRWHLSNNLKETLQRLLEKRAIGPQSARSFSYF